MTDNKQMIVDVESGEPGDQPQQAQNASESNGMLQGPQAVSTILMNFTLS